MPQAYADAAICRHFAPLRYYMPPFRAAAAEAFDYFITMPHFALDYTRIIFSRF